MLSEAVGFLWLIHHKKVGVPGEGSRWGNQAGLPYMRLARPKAMPKGLSSDAAPTPPNRVSGLSQSQALGWCQCSRYGRCWGVSTSLVKQMQASHIGLLGLQKLPHDPLLLRFLQGWRRRVDILTCHSSEDTAAVPGEHTLWDSRLPTAHQVWPWTAFLGIQPREMPSSWTKP